MLVENQLYCSPPNYKWPSKIIIHFHGSYKYFSPKPHEHLRFYLTVYSFTLATHLALANHPTLSPMKAGGMNGSVHRGHLGSVL